MFDALRPDGPQGTSQFQLSGSNAFQPPYIFMESSYSDRRPSYGRQVNHDSKPDSRCSLQSALMAVNTETVQIMKPVEENPSDDDELEF